MSDRSFFEQIRERRVIRTVLIYVALLWAALQVADLLADADIISQQLVRWLILLGSVGLPVTIVASWFLEAPWKERRWTAVAGDLVIIVAITIAVALFAWQQWFTSFTRPSVAMLRIEATDLQPASADLAAHLALRLRTALATRPEIRVIELASSLDDSLEGITQTEKAASLGADFLLTGTIAQIESVVRFNLQLFGADGRLVHGETYEHRLLDQAQLQNRVLADLWPHLPLREEGLTAIRSVIADCRYPDNRDALLAVAGIDNRRGLDSIEDHVEAFGQAGMLRLAQSKLYFEQVAAAPARQKPVLQQLAMQSLAAAETLCPSLPDIALLRFQNTRADDDLDELILRYPNSALLYRRAAALNSEPRRANALTDEARMLDPLGDW